MPRSTLAFALLSTSALACSAAGQNPASNTGGEAGTGGQGGTGGLLTGGTTTGLPTNGSCSEASQLVYVLSEENELYSFRPDLKVFTSIGKLGCNTIMQPNSMAIDRDATAWVNYVEADFFGDKAGVTFRVSTADASCEPNPSATLPMDWFRLGMGFSTDGAESEVETLYVTGTAQGPSPGLGKLDTMNGMLTPIGPFTGGLAGENAELTGTGDGRLFGFFTSSPVVVAELNKNTGAIAAQNALQDVETPTSWAFSFWGGDFYLYTAPDPTLYPNRTTNVTRYRPVEGTVDPMYMVDIGFRIVGAGVSTCAPLEPPK